MGDNIITVADSYIVRSVGKETDAGERVTPKQYYKSIELGESFPNHYSSS